MSGKGTSPTADAAREDAPIDVLALAAHPDDAEVGCAGALLRAGDQGLRVAVVDLTSGELSTQGDPETREREREAAAQVLGLAARRSLGLPDGGLGTDPGHRVALAALLRELRPRILLAPYPEDRHPDHAATGRLAREAAFLAGVRRHGTGAPHRPARIYHYLVHQPFDPTFVVDVSEVWQRRMAAVTAFASQFGRAEPSTPTGGRRFLDLLEERAGYYGAMIGAARGEPFLSVGPLGFAGLPDAPLRTQPGSYRMFW